MVLWSMVDYGTMCSEDQLIMPAQSIPVVHSESEDISQSAPCPNPAMDAREPLQGELYLPAPEQFHPEEMAFDNSFDIRSLDYLLDLAPGGGHV